MKRLLFHFLAAVSLLLCVAAIALWVRSFTQWDRIVLRRPAAGVGLLSSDGTVFLNIRWTAYTGRLAPTAWAVDRPDRWTFTGGYVITFSRDPLDTSNGRRWQNNRAFGYDRYLGDTPPGWYERTDIPKIPSPAGPRPVLGDRYTRVWFPHWSLAALLAVPPLVWCVRGTTVYLRRRRRMSHMRCATCGYDLRATPDRCPECGTATSEH